MALAGHSQGALFGEQTAARFDNIDAYLHFSFDTAAKPSLLTGFAANLLNCRTRPLPAGNEPGNPTGYGFRGANDAEFRQINFVDIDERVFRHFADERPPDPCGFPNTANQTLTVNSVERAAITVPTFVLFGQRDSNFFVPPAPELQSLGFVASKDRKLVVLPGAGHTPMLERAGAPAFRKAVSDWLTPRGF